jgi:hypothetical protein
MLHTVFPQLRKAIHMTNQLHGDEPFLRSRQSLSYSRTTQHCMKPEGSLRVHKIPPLVLISSQIFQSTPPQSYFSNCKIRHINRHIRLYTMFIMQAYQTSQNVEQRGGIFLGKWRSSFAGSSDSKTNVQSAYALNIRNIRIYTLHTQAAWIENLLKLKTVMSSKNY